MVFEEAALFGRKELFVAGIRDAFNRETGRRPLRKARGGLKNTMSCTNAVLLGRIKRGGIHRRARRSGGGVIHIPRRAVGGLSLSRGDGSQPASCPARTLSSGPGWEVHSPEPTVSAVPKAFRGGAGGSRPVHLDWVGETSAT